MESESNEDLFLRIAARMAYGTYYMSRECVAVRILNNEPTLEFEDWYKLKFKTETESL